MHSKTIALIALIIGCIGLAVSPAIFAQQEKATLKPPAAATGQSDNDALGTANYTKTDWGTKKTVLMKGDVKFTHKDTVITSDQVDFDKKTNIVVSPGPLTITDPESEVTGKKGTAFLNKRLGVLEGEVVMKVKPQQDETVKPGKDSIDKFKVPTTITCDKIEYLYKKKIATATGRVTFKQEKRTVKADNALYDQKKELLTLQGNVNGVDEDGQTFSAPGKVIISLKKGEEWMEAQNAKASFKVDLDAEDEAKPEPPKK